MNNAFKYYLYFILIAFVYSNQSIAVVTKSKGDVQYKKFSESESEILLVGSELFNDDYIKTGVDGYVKFSYLDDGTTIKIHKNSELYVAGKSENKVINKRLNIGNGLIKMDVSKQKEEEFKIVTPTSVASVKGTSFILDSNLDFQLALNSLFKQAKKVGLEDHDLSAMYKIFNK